MSNVPFSVIDAHTHAYPEALAAKVAARLGTGGSQPDPAQLTGVGIVAAQRAAGIALSVNLPIATKPSQVDGINDWVNSLPDGILSFATIHPDTPDIPAKLRELKARGFKGLKLHPEFQSFTLDDSRLLSCWEEMRTLDLVAYFHAGADRSFTAPFHTTPTDFRLFLRRFPGLRVVAAHLGGFQMYDEAEEVLCGENLFLDLSHTLDFAPDEQIVRMIRKHGADRILFATDSPWCDPRHVLARFLSLPLDDKTRDQILHRTAESLLGLAEGSYLPSGTTSRNL